MNTDTDTGTGDTSMLSFQILAGAKETLSHSFPRLGRLSVGKSGFETPTFIASTSRGVVPHLSHDNLRDHTEIAGVYVALEDFLEKFSPKTPVLNHPSTLRTFISLPSRPLLILGARRSPPVTTAAANTDDSVAILTSVGFRSFRVSEYISAVQHLQPDIALAIPDLANKTPGKNRSPKMVFRTEMWLAEMLRQNRKLHKSAAAAAAAAGHEEEEEEEEEEDEGQNLKEKKKRRKGGRNTPIFAAILPLTWETQSYYIDFLKDHSQELSGLSFYDSTLTIELPEELSHLPRLSLDEPLNPHAVLKQISWGIDVFSLGFLGAATDAGIALDFVFGEEVKEGEVGMERGKKPLGRNMWDSIFATDLEGLGRKGCPCYACQKHHRAFVTHLLATREMTAWVLLQIHNSKAMEEFFLAIRESIKRGTLEADTMLFSRIYETDLPKKTGEGPRVRGYQFKSEHAAKKKNSRGFHRFDDTDDDDSNNKNVGTGDRSNKGGRGVKGSRLLDMGIEEMRESGFAEIDDTAATAVAVDTGHGKGSV